MGEDAVSLIELLLIFQRIRVPSYLVSSSPRRIQQNC